MNLGIGVAGKSGSFIMPLGLVERSGLLIWGGCLESRRRSDGFSCYFGNLEFFNVSKVSFYRSSKTKGSSLGRLWDEHTGKNLRNLSFDRASVLASAFVVGDRLVGD
jgi:hypothetical protein